MAKRRKAPPARRREAPQMEEHSLLLRSAESLGRVIGALQRQLDDASRKLGSADGNGRRKVGGSDGSDGKGTRRAKAHESAAAHATRPRKKKTAVKRKRITH